MKRTLATVLLAAWLQPGCTSTSQPVDASIDVFNDAAPDVLVNVAPDAARPAPPTAGQDLDTRVARTLSMRCTAPQAFYDALSRMSVTVPQLAQPDLGLTFAGDPNRLHWTDELRHQGDLAPSFACMAADDVRAALASGDTETTLRELIVAQGIYGNRAAYQVSRYDRASTVDPAGQPLLAALEAFYDHAPVAGDPSPALPPWSSIASDVAEQVQRFSPAAQIALAQAIASLVTAAELRDEALTANGMDLPAWQRNLTQFLNDRGGGSATTFGAAYHVASQMSAAMDFDRLSRAAQLATRAVESLRIALRREPLMPGVTLTLAGRLGRIAVSLEPTSDTWTGSDYFLLVDGGGDDTYHDAVAVNQDLFHPIAAVLDLAGNDRYVPSDDRDFDLTLAPPFDDGQGTGIAAAWFGVALLDDAAGDDVYRAGYYEAYAMFGVGVLADHGGADRYEGYVQSQGAASFGYGLLVDLGGGNNVYETLHNGQGFGGTRGIGWLVDDGGNDRYLAITEPEPVNRDPANNPYDREGSNFSGAQGFGWGLRVFNQTTGARIAYLSGGMGALFDLAGDDRYECAVMCQGWGYFYGTGLLYDRSGNDTYRLWHKYGIGGATHQAVGVFLDEQGADTYEYVAGGVPTNGGSEGVGLGYDESVGFHIDRGPERDTYTFDMDRQHWGEVMGIARFPGLGVFINEGGDDEYHLPGVMGAYALGMIDVPAQMPAVRASMALASTRSVGMFFDLGGNDRYDVTGSAAANNSTWIQRAATTNAAMDPFDPALDHGYGADVEQRWPAW